MAIKKRLSTDTKIIYRFDESLAHIDAKLVGEYMRTLDIDKLGNLHDLTSKPSVFTVRPLTVRHEYLENGENSDWWGIFANHVKDITDFPLTRVNEAVSSEHREDFSPRLVRDIAQQVVALANDGRDSIFFTVPEGFSDWLRGAIALRVTEASRGVARSVAAKTSEQKQEASPTTTQPQQSEKSSE
jgi:hypothetical protein